MQAHDNQHILDQIERVAQLNMVGALDEMAIAVDVLAKDAQELQHDEGTLAALLYKGFLLDYRALYDESIAELEEVVALAHRLNRSDYCMRAYNSLGATYSQKADFYTGLTYYLKAYHLSENHPEYQYNYVILNNIGNLFEWLDEYKTAAEYLEMAYEKYFEDGVDDPPFLLILIINLVDVYSYLEDYDKVQEWSQNAPFDELPEGEQVVECLKIMNQAVLRYRSGDFKEAIAYIEEFFEQSKKTDDYSSIFRCFAHLLKISIELGDPEIVAKLIAHMDAMQGQSMFNSFDFHYAELRLKYYQRYVRAEHAIGDSYIDSYFDESQKTINELKRTYVNSLLVQLELDNSRLEAEKLRRDMQKDVFTNLYNKVGSERLVRSSLDEITEGTLYAFILVDIDNFKLINDFYGHHFGDEIIIETAAILEENQFPQSIVGRFGGDEYMIFSEGLANEDQVAELLSLLLERAHGVTLIDDQIPQLTFSMGVYLFTAPCTYEEAFKKADAALYRAKDQGRNRAIIVNLHNEDVTINGSEHQ
ncbi:MAG: GGDEF domain-containing protein [Raoultibacter sp.]